MALDRNQRARLIFQAESYERRTKQKGNRAGELFPSGVQLLRVIAFRFLDLRKGNAWPSYDALQAATGLCRQTIANGVKRLEAAGFLLVEGRVRFESGRIVKLTNLYSLPAETPPVPDFESLLSRRKPEDSLLIPYECLTGPLKDALERLGRQIEERGCGVPA